jgi:hypothetical protein
MRKSQAQSGRQSYDTYPVRAAQYGVGGGVTHWQVAEKSILGEIGNMRLAENKEDGEINSPLRMFFSMPIG